MESVACLLCGNRDEVELYRDLAIRVVLCRNCALGYLNPRMSQQEYRDHYQTNYQKSRHNVDTYDDAVLRLLKKKSYEAKRRYITDFKDIIKKESSVLEVGSGWGTLLKVLQDHFHCSVEGIEISKLAAGVAKKYYGLSVIEEPFEQFLEHAKKQYDVVIMRHVFEHFLEPQAILEKMGPLLKTNGSLVIVVPNLAAPDEALDRFFRIEHCSYFTPRTLTAMLGKHGFRVIRITTDEHEIRVIVVYDFPAEGVRIDSYGDKFSFDHIYAVIQSHRRKYYILRGIKESLRRILPAPIFAKFKSFGVVALRKIKIIVT